MSGWYDIGVGIPLWNGSVARVIMYCEFTAACPAPSTWRLVS
mgnify:CR=1 FL=1